MTDEEETAAPRPRLQFRLPGAALLRGSARGAVAAVAAVMGVALIVATTVTSGPAFTVGAPLVTVDPIPAAQERLCAGPVMKLGGSSGSQATVPTSSGRPSIVAAARPGRADRASLASTDNVTGVAPDRLTLPPQSASSDQRPQLSGSQSETVAAGTFAGFAAAECIESSSDTWLSAGATTVGRTSLISISNPSSVDASVDLTIWGTAGEISAPGATGIILPPGAQRVYPLSGFAPGIASTVVRVMSTGGPVVASMHESIVRTLAAGGVEIAGPSARPAEVVTIPGVIITGADAVTAASASLGFDDLGTVVRLLNPGADAASAIVTLTRATGSRFPAVPDPLVPDPLVPDAAAPVPVPVPAPDPAVPDPAVPDPAVPDPAVPDPALPSAGGDSTFTLTLEPGVVQDLPVQGLADGTYTVSVKSTAPVTASARVSTISADGAADFAWVASAVTLEERSLVAVAPGPSPTLTLANPTDDGVSVTLTDAEAERVVDVGPAASVVLSVDAGAQLELTGTDGLAAAVGYRGPGALASFPVSVPAASSTAVRVYR